ncbi:hypothetical protein FACS1894181_18390 [Bacteroidia bacterium]|nr:hypothetical protein FACS1894181_18390 [Bacteroidia bacterium]
MENVFWGFYGGKYATKEKFVDAIIAYNRKIGKTEWNPNEVVVENKQVIISYAYETGDNEVNEEFHLSAEDDTFIAGELLFEIHNQIVEHLENLDYHFFEGLIYNGIHEKYPHIPFYYLNLGS